MIQETMKTKLKNYFNKEEFKEFLLKLKNKYIQYGTCKGTINIKPKTLDEALKLSLFLSKNIKVNTSVKIKIPDIQAALDDSIFEGVEVDELVLLFYPDIKTKQELTLEKNNYLQDKLTYLKDNYKILETLLENKETKKKIEYLIFHDDKLLENILKSLSNLPINHDNFESLAIFSSNITGDPHYFDLDTHNSNVLLQFISYLYNFKYENKRIRKKEIFERVNILIDEVSNIVLTYNLYGNEMLDSFQKNFTPLTINMANLRKMDNIKTKNNKLLILENPSFLSKVIDLELDYSVIITSGNSNFVVYKLLDKIKNTKIYFNGDFDPEGLLIANNFKKRYPDLEFIGYNEDYYMNGISDKEISNSRLKKLDLIDDKDLIIIKDLLKKNKVSSYQEANYLKILGDIKKDRKGV